MKSYEEFERLRILFRRSACLPPLPATATRLIFAIDTGEASAIELERIIVADPAVTATILSLTNDDEELEGTSTIRQAIMRLGQRAIRTLAVSLTIKAFVREVGSSENQLLGDFAKHSLAVGVAARYLFARTNRFKETVNTTWSADEVFAAGLLHDLAYPLLGLVAPEVVRRVAFYGERHRVSFSSAFSSTILGSLGELGAEAVTTWKLPELFVTTQTFLSQPWMCPTEFDALSCIVFADYLASTHLGLPLEPWPQDYDLMQEVECEFDLSDQEIEMLRNAVLKTIDTVNIALAA